MPIRSQEHTVKRYDEELDRLHKLVLDMGAMVKDQIRRAVKALGDRDTDAAREVMDRDHVVNGIDVVADDITVNLLALRQPMGSDLRTIMSWNKSVADLERIGDEANKIARMTLQMYDSGAPLPKPDLLRDVSAMSRLAINMVQGALDAVKHVDTEKAMEIVQGDEELDHEFAAAQRRLTTYVMDDHRNVGHMIDVVSVLKALERIGDHAKNIAEYVVYLVEGERIRHVSPSALTAEMQRDRKQQQG